MTEKHVLLVEFRKGHSELFYSHVVLFKEMGWDISFLGAEDFSEVQRDHYPHFKNVLLVKKSELGSFAFMRKARGWIKEHSIDLLIFNTSTGRPILKLCFYLPRSIQKIGVIHSADRFISSGSQRILRMTVKKFLFLSEQIFQTLPTMRGVKSSFFYPIYFDAADVPKIASSEMTRVVVAGNVEQKRRDYTGLVRFVAENKTQLVGKCLFYLLGNSSLEDGVRIRAQCKELGIEDFFVFYDHFITTQEYYSIVAQSDCVMSLIHPTILDFSHYLSSKISGSFNLAYGFQKPLLMHEAFGQSEEFKDTSLFYSDENLLELLLSSKIKEFEYPYIKRFDKAEQARRLRIFIET